MSAAAADVAGRDHLLVWETGAVGQIDEPAMAGAGRSFIRLAPMGGNLGRSAMRFIENQWAPAVHAPANLRYAVAYVDDAYGRSVALGATDEIKALGQNLVGSFGYDPSTKSFEGLAQTIKAAKPDVLFVTAYIDDGVALRRATVAAHIPLLTSIGTSSSYCHPEFGRQLGTEAVGLFASDKPDAGHLNPDSLLPDAKAALAWASAQFRSRYGTEMTAPALSGFSNASALFSYVLPRASIVTPASVAAAAVATKLPVGTLANGGGLDIAAPGRPDAGDNRRAASVIWEWVAPGVRAVVWPKAFATQSLSPLTPAR
jgi:ABC-type branched-subunit amino acid transport system substrate-binding protein